MESAKRIALGEWDALLFGRSKSLSIGRNNANTESRKPLYRVYKVGPVKLYTVVSILRF